MKLTNCRNQPPNRPVQSAEERNMQVKGAMDPGKLSVCKSLQVHEKGLGTWKYGRKSGYFLYQTGLI